MSNRSGKISKGFDSQERKRFHNLLKLAAESPFEGERDAALAAAKRLAARCGMDLREAAAAPDPDVAPPPRRSASGEFWRRAAARKWDGRGFEPPPGFEDRWGRVKDRDLRGRKPDDEKRQWRAAYEAARRRGLDPEEQGPKPPPRRHFNRPKSDRRKNPFMHARSLILETTLPLTEIAAITRLTIYQVVGLKLKMREEAAAPRRARA